jgi:hypothetical protein
MNNDSNQSSKKENQQANPDTTEARTADPLDLVEQQLEQQPTIDPEELVGNPAITPQMPNEGDNLRGDLRKEE